MLGMGALLGQKPEMRVQNPTGDVGHMIRDPQGNYQVSPQQMLAQAQAFNLPWQTVAAKKAQEEANRPQYSNPLSAFFPVFNRNNLPSSSYGAFGPRWPGIRGN
jgi:hypothetical protein